MLKFKTNAKIHSIRELCDFCVALSIPYCYVPCNEFIPPMFAIVKDWLV